MLTNFYNHCFQNGIIPNYWKKAILSPIYKGGNKHVFVLSSVLISQILKKKSRFCCFVDFAKAFDSMDRELLIYALQEIGIHGRFIQMIRVMYKDTFMAIQVNDKISHWFKTYAGVRQDQNDSPSVFSALLNSLAESIKQANVGITVGEVVISILLYAEDIVLLSETEEQLQKCSIFLSPGVQNGE